MLKITSAAVAATVAQPQQYPPDLGLDIVLVGRSNVGKSSLINCLINRKNLARTSSNPGKTRTLNFYSVNAAWYFVDLPGYGYAKVSHAQQNSFKKMVDDYFDSRRPMVIWQIVDLRHEPSAQDLQMREFILAKGLPYLVVATKADKLSKSNQAKNRARLQRLWHLGEGELILFSAFSGLNKEALLKEIEGLLPQ